MSDLEDLRQKLFVALLTQKLVRIGRELSPWGYVFEGQTPTQ